MSTYPCNKVAIACGILAIVMTIPAGAQTCNTLAGGTNCNAPGPPTSLPDRRDWDLGPTGGNQGFGSDLLAGRDGSDPGMLGGIVFNKNGANCVGPFRARKC